jgi:hypothetical protein
MKRIIGTCLLGITLFGCAVAPSNTMRGTGSSGGGYNRYEQQIQVQLDQHRSALRGYRMDDQFIGTMNHGGSYRLNATAQRGQEIVITGACDQDCSDLDLIIYDDRGRELDRDVLVDDFPVLRLRAPYSGDYEVEVVMYQCSVNPCYFGVGLFTD